jgi:hypothetical protein
MVGAQILSPAWFADNIGILCWIAFIFLVAYFTYKKTSKKKKQEASRVEKSISEKGIIRHHAKKIIRNYGHESFLNMTSEEIEATVYEYNDLFKMRYDRDMVTNLVIEIADELNDIKMNK